MTILNTLLFEDGKGLPVRLRRWHTLHNTTKQFGMEISILESECHLKDRFQSDIKQ